MGTCFRENVGFSGNDSPILLEVSDKSAAFYTGGSTLSPRLGPLKERTPPPTPPKKKRNLLSIAAMGPIGGGALDNHRS